MSALLTRARRFRRRLLFDDRAAQIEMTRAYRRVLERLDAEAGRIERRIARARARGEVVSPALLYQERRVDRLQEQVLEEVARFNRTAEPLIRRRVQQAAADGIEDATILVDVATPEMFSPRLPTGAIEQAVAATERGAPLRELLNAAAQDAAGAATNALVGGVATGRNPRVIAREITRVANIPLSRAMLIARTETLRAYRESSRIAYTANRDVIEGWTWICALDSRSCASCIAQHGSVYPLDEPMPTHPNCRCTMAPKTYSWRDLGFDIDEPEGLLPEPGPEWFARQPVSVQEAVLGRAAARAYRGNQVRLDDFVARRVHPTWGASTRQAGLAEAKRNATLRRTTSTRRAA